jgi:uracil-DNA glycosylase family 4
MTLEDKIQCCKRCNLCELALNKLDIQKGFGKLLGWKGGNKLVKYMFIGLNPSYNRFPNIKYAFGGRDFEEGTGVEFIKILKDIGILEDSYVSNLVKCSSTDNDIKREYVEQCLWFLKEEVEIYQPEKIIALGKKVDLYIKELNVIPEWYDYHTIWHPNFCVSYARNRLPEYINKIKEITIGF